jgi:hypothetical protein
MLFGVLQMPYDMAMGDELSRRQFYDRAQQALAMVEELRRDAERYRWLRDLPEGSPHEQIGNFPGYMWDDAIDAGMAEAKGAEG